MKKRAEELFAGLTLTAILIVFGIGYVKSGMQQEEQTAYGEPASEIVSEIISAPAPESMPVIIPEPTPEPMLVITPEPTPETTLAPMPAITQEPTPETTPAPTPAITPEPVPVTTPASTTTPVPGEEITPEPVLTTPVLTTSDLLHCINAHRSHSGLAAFVWNDTLAEGALVRSVEIVSCFGHERPDGTDFFTVCEPAMAENLARGYFDTTAEEIVEKWMESDSGHKQNILDSSFTSVGIHVYVYEDRIAVCVLFG